MLKKLFIGCLSAFCVTTACAQGFVATSVGAKVKPKKWVSMAPKLKDAFFSTDEARQIGDNVLLYQQTTGGWPKNVDMQLPLDENRRAEVLRAKDNVNESTIDNKATSTELVYLVRLYNATGAGKYLDGAVRGMEYLFEAQYDNGGWPQFYPRPKGYYTHITYNDDAMVNVLKIMRDVAKGKKPFAAMPDSIRAKAAASLAKGVECIIKTQVVQNGRPTVWCAQYDEHTLEPAKARAYELVSLSGQESDDIVLFLMSLPKSTKGVAECVENAVNWFRSSMITGLKREDFVNADGKHDYRMTACGADDKCPALWARFYTIDGNRPFFSDRDGVIKYDISEIGYERRDGYRWYNSDGLEVLAKYEEWKAK